MEKFVENQLALLEKERQLEIDENSELLGQRSVQQLQRRGLALGGLRITALRTGLGGKSVVDFEPPLHLSTFLPHRIRSGDIIAITEDLRVSVNTPTGTSLAVSKTASANPSATVGAPLKPNETVPFVDGVVLKVTDTVITVAVKEELPVEWEDRCKMTKLANNISYERMKWAMLDLKREKESSLIRVLFNLQAPSHSTKFNKISFFDKNLNDSQKQAVKFALNTNEIGLIHGPPGTGKTYTLIEIIRQLAKQEKKILVCGPSNISVDNLVERLAKCRLNILRVGHPARILPAVVEHALDVVTQTCDQGQLVNDIRKEMDQTMANIQKSRNRTERKGYYQELRDLKREFRVREGRVVEELFEETPVILSTLNGCGSRTMKNRKFDVVIIDEATQALEAECWIAILKAKKVILAGDHLQLPPTIKSLKSNRNSSPTTPEHPDPSSGKSLEVTLFDRMLAIYGDKIKSMLTTQYRMHELIMKYPSMELYEDKLIAHESVRERLLCQLTGVEETDDTISPLVFIDTAHASMNELAEAGDSEKDGDSKYNEGEVTIVIEHVKNLVDAGVSEEDIAVITPYNAQVKMLTLALKEVYPNLEIGSVDGFQGREKEAVIFSMVRSNDSGEVGFLSDSRRLNVAITRPKRHLCVIGNSETVGMKDEFLRKYCEWVMDNGEVRYADY